MTMKILRFVVLALTVLCASCSVNQMVKRADKKYEIGEYYKAAGIYRLVYPRISATKDRQRKAYVAYRMGSCYALVNDNTKAERTLRNATHYHCSDSASYLLYADVLRKNKNPKEAVKNYDVYLQGHPNDQQAVNGKKSAEEAIDWQKNPTRYRVAPVKELLSKRSEANPAFPAGDSDVVYFSTSRTEKGEKRKASKITGIPTQNIYTSRRNSAGIWDNIEPMEGDVNTNDDEGSPCFSADGKVMYYTRCRAVKGETLGADIMMCTRSGGKWGKSVKVQLSKDSSVVFAHPTISSDGRILYFVSDLKGGYGGKDIWFSVKDGDKWGAPQNCGPMINTAGDEMFPTLRNDTVLYFSSNGWPGFGGLDIFYATLDRAGHWSPVHNMMYPINSNMDDFGMSFVKEGEKGMFASNRDDRKGYDKLWSFVLPPVLFAIDGHVTATSGESLGDATVRIVGNDGTNVKLRTKKNGTFSYPLKRNVKYVLLGNCRGYLNQKMDLSTDSLDDSKTFSVDMALSSISKPVGLDNIFFDFGKASLTAASYRSLDKLVKLLNDNPNVTIEIGAHTDRIGSAEGNLDLSGKRAQSVVDYLVHKGIEPERLTAKGYGKSDPMVVDRKLAQKYNYMQEGQILDDAALDKMTSDQQDVANQVNRRTEFRVLKTTYKMY